MRHIASVWKRGTAPLVLGVALLAGPALAQTTDTQPGETNTNTAAATDAPAARPAPSIVDGPAPSTLTPDTPDNKDEDKGAAIVVTGTRLSNPNLKATSPVTSINTDEIKASGKTSAEDLLNQMPQVFASQGSTVNNGASGIATVDLRGLGTNRTLVLINGRRLMPGDPQSGAAADLNFIPMSLVKRVDVLTGGASATYGADAVAGVVNFVLDTDFTGIRVDFDDGMYNHYNGSKYAQNLMNAAQQQGQSGYNYPQGSTWDGNGFTGTITAGTKFDDGRGHIMAYFTHRHQNAVTQAARDYSSCSINSSGKACGGSATANPGNAVYYAKGASSSTVGALGNGTISRGSENLYNYAPTNYLQRDDNRYTAGIFADYEVSNAIHPYMEFMFMSDRTKSQLAPSGDFGNTTTINCDNPYLTSAQKTEICNSSNMVTGYTSTGYPITAAGDQSLISTAATNSNTAYLEMLWRNTNGAPRTEELDHQSYRGVLGTRGDLGHGWAYDTYVQYGRTGFREQLNNDVSVSRLTKALDAVTDSSGNVVCASGSSDGCSPLNIFSGTPSAAALSYISANGTITGYTSELVASGQATADLTGYGIKTPWADTGVNLAIGTEFRREGLALHPDEEFSSGDLAGAGGATLPVSGSYWVAEAIFEASIPIIQDKLNFDTAYRFSHYEISNGRTFNTNTYKFGLDYAPIPDIRFRASFNRAVRAPTLEELFAPQAVGLDGSTDPCADQSSISTSCAEQGVTSSVASNPAGQYNGLTGGNPNLKPETSYTKTLGVVLQPRFLKGFSLSTDYYNIRIDNAIQTYGADAILAACSANASSSACSLIHRASNGSLWMSSDGYVEDIPHNIGWLKEAGFDVNATYTRNVKGLGRLVATLNGTVLSQYAVNNGLTESYDCAGYYGVTCGTPAPIWRHKARLALQTHNKTEISLAWRYVGPVDVDYSNPSSTLHSTSYSSYAAHIGSYNYFDLSVSGTVNRYIQARAGVNNIFDKDPPLVGSSSCASTYCNANTYPGVYDALGRYVYVGVTLQI